MALRNEADKAFSWLRKAVEYEDAGRWIIAAMPFLANIHSDHRWLPFLESIGMSPWQPEAVDFDVALPN